MIDMREKQTNIRFEEEIIHRIRVHQGRGWVEARGDDAEVVIHEPE